MTSDPSGGWQTPSGHPHLVPGAVHIWRANLDAHAVAPEAARLLSVDERERSARFHFERDRLHFTIARGLLRRLLARYVSADAASLRFGYGAHGKPCLPDSPLRFNLSHSGGVALFAFALECAVGVDVERVRPDFARREVAERFFSPVECAALFALPESAQPDAFFACWTRKEAYIKSLGAGMSVPLDSFDVTLAPGEPARLLAVRDASGAIGSACDEAAHWTLVALDVLPGYQAALAVEGQPAGIALYDASLGPVADPFTSPSNAGAESNWRRELP